MSCCQLGRVPTHTSAAGRIIIIIVAKAAPSVGDPTHRILEMGTVDIPPEANNHKSATSSPIPASTILTDERELNSRAPS